MKGRNMAGVHPLLERERRVGIWELIEGVVPAFHCSLIGALEGGESVPCGGNGLELYRDMKCMHARRGKTTGWSLTGGWSTDDARGREGN
jgi:hypothetical protein